MIREMAFYGLLLPPILAWGIAALVVTMLASRVLGRIGFYRLVWHRSLFDVAVFVIVLGAIAALIGIRHA